MVIGYMRAGVKLVVRVHVHGLENRLVALKRIAGRPVAAWSTAGVGRGGHWAGTCTLSEYNLLGAPVL
jgi:hypothetical protein